MHNCPRPMVIMKFTVSAEAILGSADEVAFVFAVLGVDDYNDSPLANGLKSFVDR